MTVSLKKAVFSIYVAQLLITPGAWAEDEADRLTEHLIQLRGQVEDAGNQLSLMQEEHKLRMKNLYNEGNDLQAQAEHLRNKNARAQQDLEQRRQRIVQKGGDDRTLKPVVEAAIVSLTDKIQDGLPFKRDERLAALLEMREQLNSGVIPAHKVAARLWAFVEDELVLRRQSGVYRQVVELNGEQVLADVARIGMVMLYFRTGDARFGKAQFDGHAWRYVLFEQNEQQSQVAALFDAFNKQIRSGRFELPNALSKSRLEM